MRTVVNDHAGIPLLRHSAGGVDHRQSVCIRYMGDRSRDRRTRPCGNPTQIGDWWEATSGERADIFELVDEVRATIDQLHRPDGYNVGFNAGTAAGQTVDHLHIHVIPRYLGDVAEPQGGIRNLLAAGGAHTAQLLNNSRTRMADDIELSAAAPVLIDGQVRLLLPPQLIRHLRNTRFDRIDIVVSFIKMSGLNLILDPLEDALQRGAGVRSSRPTTSGSPKSPH